MRALEIIHLEANDLDAELVQEHLREGGIDAHLVRVRTEAEFREQVERPELQVILAACHCPGYDGFKALTLARERRPDVPFVFVSGTLPERDAMQSLQSGVGDFVRKDCLSQLTPVVRRVVREATARMELLAARQDLSAQAELLDLANDSIILSDARGKITTGIRVHSGSTAGRRRRRWGRMCTSCCRRSFRRPCRTWARRCGVTSIGRRGAAGAAGWHVHPCGESLDAEGAVAGLAAPAD